MADTLTEMPDSFAAGTTVTYRRTVAAYPAGGVWNLTVYLSGVSTLAKVAGQDGEEYVVTLTAAETATLGAGKYQWVERVVKSPEVFEVASGTVVVEPNIATAAAGSMQTWEEKTLVVVEAALTGKLTADMESYSIHGRTVNKIPTRELMQIRAELKRAVNAQRNPGKLGPTVLAQFVPNEPLR